MTKGIKRLALCSAAIVALSACVAAPTTMPLATPLRNEELGLRGTPAPAIGASWWNAFGDPQLDRLIARAFEGSPTLAAALARIREAQSQLSQARAGTYPQAVFDAND